MAQHFKDELDHSWIESGLDKNRSRFSSVIFFETDDPQRYRQLLEYLPNVEDFTSHELYELTPWTGLQRMQEGNFSPTSRGDGDRFSTGRAEQANMGGNLRDMQESLRHVDTVLKQRPAILILRDVDRADAHMSPPNEGLVAAIRSWANSTELMLQNSVVLCFCHRAENLVDSQTASRVAVIPIDLGTDMERFCILYRVMDALGYNPQVLVKDNQKKLFLQTLVQLTAGLNLHQLNSILMESHYKDGEMTLDRVSALKSEWIKREDVVEIIQPDGGFEKVGGYQQQKVFIKENIIRVLGDVSRANHWGIRLPKGILLFGPPGTGKSLFAKALAGETNLPFINLKTENLFKKYLGESGQSFAKAIAIIEKNAPAIVFIDEIDRFGSRRAGSGGDGASQESRRVFNQLLEWLGEERGSILVGTTNRPGDLDPALLRPGRLDYKIAMLHPDCEARKNILRIHLGLTNVYPGVPMEDERVLEQVAVQLAEQTRFFSGAELEELVHRIRRKGFNSGNTYLLPEHVQEGLQAFRIDPDERAREVEEYRRMARTYADHADMTE